MTQPPYPPDPSNGGQQPDPYAGQQPDPYAGQQPGQTPPPQYGQTPPQYGQTPPPQPQYGQAPPPPPGAVPPGPAYGQVPPGGYPGGPPPGQAGDPNKVDVGAAFNWAWSKFKNNVGVMILPGVVAFLVFVVIGVIAAFATALTTTTNTVTAGAGTAYESTYEESTFSVGGAILLFLISLVAVIALFYIQASIISGAIRVANGEAVTATSFLVPTRFGPVIITAVLVGLITSIGYVLCIVPGLLAIFFLQFAIVATIDKSLSPVEAMKSSFELSKSKVGDSLITLVVTWAINAVGAIVCYIGLIVSAPLAQLFFVHCWRRLNGAPIAPPDPT